MKDIKIVPMNLETDKPQIQNWETEFAGTEELKNIERFVLENRLIKDLGELIETNFEHCQIGLEETKNAFSIKLENGEIIGFIICQAFDLLTKTPELFIQYIAFSPKFQNQGYGKASLTEFFSNIKKYIGTKPFEIFTYVDKENLGSQIMFRRFGFLFPEHKKDYPYLLQGEAKMQRVEELIASRQSQPN